MAPERYNQFRSRQRIQVAWKDCAWFPPVLAGKGVHKARRPVYWPVQIITDPTVCASRTLDPIQL